MMEGARGYKNSPSFDHCFGVYGLIASRGSGRVLICSPTVSKMIDTWVLRLVVRRECTGHLCCGISVTGWRISDIRVTLSLI